VLLQRPVDLRMPTELSPYFRNEVLRMGEVQHVQG
jgi:predicted nucleotidyltransferase